MELVNVLFILNLLCNPRQGEDSKPVNDHLSHLGALWVHLHGNLRGGVVPGGQGGILDDLVVVVPLPDRGEDAANELVGVRLADGAAHPGVEVHVRLLPQDAPEIYIPPASAISKQNTARESNAKFLEFSIPSPIDHTR